MRIHYLANSYTVCSSSDCVYISVLYPDPFKALGTFYFQTENRTDILNRTLLTRTTAHNKQWGSKHKHHIQLDNYLEIIK